MGIEFPQEQVAEESNCYEQRSASPRWAIHFGFWAVAHAVPSKQNHYASTFVYVMRTEQIYYLICMFLQDQEQLQAVTESVLISFVLQCSSHAPQSEFLLFATRCLCARGHLRWDSLLPSLLNVVSSVEVPMGQGVSVTTGGPATSSSSAIAVPNAPSFHASNPTSPLSAMNTIGSPTQSGIDQPIGANVSPIKGAEFSSPGQLGLTARGDQSRRGAEISYLHHLSCRIILAGLESDLKPATHAVIFQHMVNWLVNWDQRPHGVDQADALQLQTLRLERPLHEWMHLCLDVIWILVNEDKCRVPFYELVRSNLQFLENIPDDEALVSIIMEIHRRRDMVCMHMQMLDQHLHCPTFATHRFLSQSYPSIVGESVANLRYSPITYPSVLGEPLHGEVILLFPLFTHLSPFKFAIEPVCIDFVLVDWSSIFMFIRYALHIFWLHRDIAVFFDHIGATSLRDWN